jgi:hypothetical protein
VIYVALGLGDLEITPSVEPVSYMGPIAQDTARDPLCPDFLQCGTSRGQLCTAFFTESRMQFGDPIKLHRKSGQGGSRTWSPLHSGIYETGYIALGNQTAHLKARSKVDDFDCFVSHFDYP